MFKPIRMTVFAAALIAIPAATQAHHGWADYDSQKLVKVTAPLTEISWTNPHGGAKVVHEGKTWAMVLANPSRMQSRGLTREMLKPGLQVTLEGRPRLDGTLEMKVERVTVEGKTIEIR